MNKNPGDIFCLNSGYSTTRTVTRDEPEVEHADSSKSHTQLFLSADSRRQGEGGLRRMGYFKKSFNDKPLISIITVVFNCREHIEQTIRSVLEMKYPNIEYIVIDGGPKTGPSISCENTKTG